MEPLAEGVTLFVLKVGAENNGIVAVIDQELINGHGYDLEQPQMPYGFSCGTKRFINKALKFKPCRCGPV